MIILRVTPAFEDLQAGPFTAGNWGGQSLTG